MSRDVPLDTQRRQALASGPDVSAWVSANAGSGKTHVLATRVVRLLLAGTPPSKILCLTFTKAAAANMSLRVFNTLSAWTRLDDAALSAAIGKIQSGVQPDRVQLDEARRLFARAVETPGGLKIQTIHAFCERLLHLFPFESNVAAGFEVLAEQEQQELLALAREHAFAEASRDESSESARALGVLAAETSESEFGDLIAEALRHRVKIATKVRDFQGARNWGAAMAAKLGLAVGEDVASINQALLEQGLAPASWSSIAARIGADGGPKDSCGNRLARAAVATDDTRLDAYLRVFLTKELAPRAASYLTKPVRSSEPALAMLLDAEQERLVALLEKRKCALVVQRSVALFHVIEKILHLYADQKSLRGLLDFDDLIERTHKLLSRSESSAAWVLYKLDAGIDHILVDEAQDTSPAQWSILQKIAEAFTSGFGARDTRRTFFAVGDEKQSIYSFQGASPGMFEKMQREFGARIEKAHQEFAAVRLNVSFRSAPEILRAVDAVFDNPAVFHGVIAKSDQVWPEHESWKKEHPGLIEIWNDFGAKGVDNPEDWRLPLDRQDANDPPVILAQRIAAQIRSWLSPDSLEAVHDEDGEPRRIRAGDILILVRRRSAFFEAVIRALKDAGVPVAGADRLVLNEHIAVMDLVAAGRAALLPEDDLTLACVLKSPLIGLDDDDLLRIAPRRKGSLWDALRASPEDAHRAAVAVIGAWTAKARSLSPFGFYAWILGAGAGRKKMLSRLGAEAGDAIDEFVRLALEHERMHAPSLVAFLHQLDTAPVEIKRDMEAAGDAVRVMTVHGSKGLESKIVFLPDTMGSPTGRHDPKIYDLEDEEEKSLLVWGRTKKLDPEPLGARRNDHRTAQEEEYRRLLYVAMTRAEERLYISGFYQTQRPAGGWYDTVRQALEPRCDSFPSAWDATEMVLRSGKGLQLASLSTATSQLSGEAATPDWLFKPAPFEIAPAPPVSPSHALGAADQKETAATPDSSAIKSAALIGRLTHALLQHLPGVEKEKRPAIGLRYLAARAGHLPDPQKLAILTEALGLIDAPHLAQMFGEGSRVEVAVAGRLARPNGKWIDIAGQIDRLAVLPHEVWIADFKTGRARGADETPETYLTQLALYRAVLGELYKDRPVRALLIWTQGPQIVEIDAARMDAALERALRG